MKKIIVNIMLLAIPFLLVACGASVPAEPADLTGTWKQTNSQSDDAYQEATISGDTIEIYWVSDGGDTKALYWAGTYVAPSDAKEPYSWDSQGDREQMDSALLASQDDAKTITYEKGTLSYTASALGTTTTIKMKKQ